MRPWHPGCQHPENDPENDQFCIFCLRKIGDDASARAERAARREGNLVQALGSVGYGDRIVEWAENPPSWGDRGASDSVSRDQGDEGCRNAEEPRSLSGSSSSSSVSQSSLSRSNSSSPAGSGERERATSGARRCCLGCNGAGTKNVDRGDGWTNLEPCDECKGIGSFAAETPRTNEAPPVNVAAQNPTTLGGQVWVGTVTPKDARDTGLWVQPDHQCGENSPDKVFTCTVLREHAGAHVAVDPMFGNVRVAWPNTTPQTQEARRVERMGQAARGEFASNDEIQRSIEAKCRFDELVAAWNDPSGLSVGRMNAAIAALVSAPFSDNPRSGREARDAAFRDGWFEGVNDALDAVSHAREKPPEGSGDFMTAKDRVQCLLDGKPRVQAPDNPTPFEWTGFLAKIIDPASLDPVREALTRIASWSCHDKARGFTGGDAQVLASYVLSNLPAPRVDYPQGTWESDYCAPGEECGERGPVEKMECSRSKGHEGEHRAWGNQPKPLERWTDPRTDSPRA